MGGYGEKIWKDPEIMKYFDAIRQQGNRHGNVREVPGSLDALERVQQRFLREGRSEGRVHLGSSKGPRNDDWICEKSGKRRLALRRRIGAIVVTLCA